MVRADQLLAGWVPGYLLGDIGQLLHYSVSWHKMENPVNIGQATTDCEMANAGYIDNEVFKVFQKNQTQ